MSDAPECTNETGTCNESGRGLTHESPDLFSLAKSLYRQIPSMPKASRRFAYNLIEQLDRLQTAEGEQRALLLKAIPYQMARLAG